MAKIKVKTLSSSVTLLCVMATIPLTSVRASAQTDSTVLYSASAYGAGATVGSTVVVARVAPVSIGPGCGTAQVGAHQTKTVASVVAPPLILSSVITTNASSSSNESTGSADVLQANLLSGLITGDEVFAVSKTSRDSLGNLTVSAAGSHFVNLVVLGKKISSTPAPNTTISLAGIGRVVLNE